MIRYYHRANTNFLIWCSFVLLLQTLGCGQKTTKPGDSKIYGLASPIHLLGDTTRIIQSDYFTTPVIIDSISSDDKTLQVSYIDDFIFIVAQRESKTISNLTVYAEGLPYSFLVKKSTPMSLSTNAPKIQTLSFTKTEVLISSKYTDGIYAYWNNFRIQAKRDGDNFKLLIPPFAKYEVRSHIRVYGYNKTFSSNDLLIPLAKGKVITETSKLNNSDWHSSVIYDLMIDRFANGDATNDNTISDPNIPSNSHYAGGDIKGITQKIQEGYFSSLGINTLLLSPITQNPEDAWAEPSNTAIKQSGYHGRWPITSATVDYRLGTAADVEEMLRIAHKNGLSVLLDYVAGYVHQQHAVYQKHSEWMTPQYTSDSTASSLSPPWRDTFLPSLDLERQKVADFMVDSLLHWITVYDFDGFRYANSTLIPSIFWRTLNKRIDQIGAEKKKYIYQIGTTHSSLSLQNIGSGLLDGEVDNQLHTTALSVLVTGDKPMTSLVTALENSLNTFGSHHLMGNITSGSTTPRIMHYAFSIPSIPTAQPEDGLRAAIADVDSLAYRKLALFNAFNLTIPGIPILYYGDEIGLTGAKTPDNHKKMRFENLKKYEESLKNELTELIRFRNENLALVYGDFTLLENTEKTLKYSRKYFDNKVTVSLDKTTWAYEMYTINDQ